MLTQPLTLGGQNTEDATLNSEGIVTEMNNEATRGQGWPVLLMRRPCL